MLFYFLGSFVPKNFARRILAAGSFIDDRTAIATGSMYLKQCMGPERNVADVFANYFASNEEINTSRVKTKSIKYLPRYNFDSVLNAKDPNNRTASLEIGYSQFLPYEKTELINTAIALYMITDEDGKTDFSKIPKLDFPRGQYLQYLRIPEK